MPMPTDGGQVATTQAAARAQFDKINGLMKQLRATQGELAGLTAKGASIDIGDVIESAEKLVAFGADPKKLAAELADAPEGGPEALQGWIKSLTEQNASQEQQLLPMLAFARHELGVAAMHVLVHHSMGPAGGPADEPPAEGPPPGPMLSANPPSSPPADGGAPSNPLGA